MKAERFKDYPLLFSLWPHRQVFLIKKVVVFLSQLIHTDTERFGPAASQTSQNTLFNKTTLRYSEKCPRKHIKTTVPAFWMHQTVSPSFCPCQVQPSCDCSLSLSSCFGSIAACFHSWRPSSVYSALLPTCRELEARMIYPGTQPETATFSFQGHSNVIQEFLGFTSGAEKYSRLTVSHFILAKKIQRALSLWGSKKKNIYSKNTKAVSTSKNHDPVTQDNLQALF